MIATVRAHDQERPGRVAELASSTPTVTQARKLKTGSTALTAKQAQTLSALRACAKKYGVGATRSELKKALQVSKNTSVDKHLQRLADKGWILLHPGIERGIVLLREGAPLYEPEQLKHTETEICLRGEGPAEPAWIDYEVLWDVFGAKPDLCLRVRGNAMERAGLADGAIVALSRNRDAQGHINIADGDIVAAYIDDKVVLRSVRNRAKGTVELYAESTSDEHKSVLFEPGSDRVEIVGVVIGRMVRGAR